jgi:hypothetical protein
MRQTPAPVIDFETQQVVVGGVGAKPSTGYSILIAGVNRMASEYVVQAIDFEHCLGLTIIAYPIAGVVIPKTDLPVKVHLQQARAVCQ